jgi:hypothetical protein
MHSTSGRATNRSSVRADAALDGAHATPDRVAGRSGLRALCCPRSCGEDADDAAEPRVQELQLPPGALGRPQLALTQFDTLAFGQIDQLLDRAVGEPGVGRMRDRFLLHGGVRATRSRSLVSIAPLQCAAERLSCNSAANRRAAGSSFPPPRRQAQNARSALVYRKG